ncbi:MAG: hypothetical protein JWP75_400 [Frondihabitans sp.]|nr:hypothetical protein [Frondihabitans sp.]
MGSTGVDTADTNRTPSQSPRISLGSWAFSFGPFEEAPWSFDRFSDYAADHGYDGVEINGFRPHPHDGDFDRDGALAIRDRLDSKGLGISGYAPDLRSTPPGVGDPRAYLDRIDSVARFGEALGVTTVRIDTIAPPPGPDGHERERQISRVVDVWRRSSDRLADSGIDLVWEFEPGFWLNRPSDIARIVREVDRPNFGILFDTSHAHTIGACGARQGDNPEILPGGAVEFARLVSGSVRHLHLIDSDGTLHDGDTSEHVPFGLGDVNFPGVLDALGQAAARLPWWTVDFCFCPTTVRDAAAAVPIVQELRDDLLTRLAAKENHQ